MRTSRRPDPDLGDALPDLGVADECASFLAGTWVDACHDDRHVAPVWSWLNEAAHADAERLREVAAMDDDGTCGPERRTRAALAHATLAAAEWSDLEHVQRELLIPLELRVIGTVLSPRRLLELTADALF